MQLPNIDVYLLDGQSDLQKISLREVCAGKSGVIDIWHTRCTRCPAALDKLHAEYQKIFMNNPKVQFVALALSQGPGNIEDVAELGPESWEDFTHVFADEESKNVLKSCFGYSAVPFYVVYDKDGTVVKMGEPKSMDYIAEVEACINAENVKPVATHEDGVDLTTAEPSSTKAPLESAVSRPAFDFNDEDF